MDETRWIKWIVFPVMATVMAAVAGVVVIGIGYEVGIAGMLVALPFLGVLFVIYKVKCGFGGLSPP